MCRELNREPAWVAAIRLAYLRGEVTVESVVEEANLIPGRERTVQDILETMARRELLRETPVDGQYVPGPILLNSNRSNLDFSKASNGGAHRWRSSV